MSKFSRALAASALMTLALSACASIETRGLAKCSGHDRRPMNADLWAWEQTQPRRRFGSDQQDPPLKLAPTARRRPALRAIDDLTSVDQPRWDIAASEVSCR